MPFQPVAAQPVAAQPVAAQPVAAQPVAGQLRARAAGATDEFVAGYSSVWVPRTRGLSTPKDRRIAN